MSEEIIKSWSTLEIKGVDDDLRIIKGVASTPSTDRAGDIVEPLGAKFTLPLPLLSQHQHDRPIGQVVGAVVTEKGIEIEAKIPKDSGIGYVDMAWKQIKAGLISGLSIGFQATKSVALKNGGRHFKEWNWHELSAVTIPCNSDATIATVKRFDEAPVDPGQLVQREMELHDAREQAAAAIANIDKHLKLNR